MYNQPPQPHDGYNQSSYEQAPYSQGYEQQYGQPPSAPYSQGYEQQYAQPPSTPYGQGYEQPYGQPPSTPYGQPYNPTAYGQPGEQLYTPQVPLYAQPQQQWQFTQGMQPRKDWLTTLLLCIFLGPLGVHRFYSGSVGLGLLQFFTAGGFGIWWLIDFILIVTDTYRDSYGQPLVK